MAKVSIVIPVYNVEEYLRKCLDSVVNQSLNDIEIICVDDGSTDSSLEILKEYAQNDKRIKILVQKNQHAGVARNNGLKIATGEYVHFLDSDDWIELDAYEKLYKILKETGADFLKFKGYSYNNKTKELTTRPYLDIKRVDDKYFNNYLNIYDDTSNIVYLPDSPWSGFYNLEFLKKNNIYFDDFVCANDVGFFYRCIVNAKKVYLSPERLIYYRENMDDSLVAKRGKNFYCQTALYDIVKTLSKDLPPEVRNILINKIILATFGWYNICLRSDNSSKRDQNKIKKIMNKYLKHIVSESLSENNMKTYKQIKADLKKEKITKFKNILAGIFSIKNIKKHKVFCLFWIKLKIKRN